jgi:hypothetical protein
MAQLPVFRFQLTIFRFQFTVLALQLVYPEHRSLVFSIQAPAIICARTL